jgi:hypothetical protein
MSCLTLPTSSFRSNSDRIVTFAVIELTFRERPPQLLQLRFAKVGGCIIYGSLLRLHAIDIALELVRSSRYWSCRRVEAFPFSIFNINHTCDVNANFELFTGARAAIPPQFTPVKCKPLASQARAVEAYQHLFCC